MIFHRAAILAFVAEKATECKLNYINFLKPFRYVHVLVLKLRNLDLAQLVPQELLPISVIVVTRRVVSLRHGTLLTQMMTICGLRHELELLNLF